MSVQGKKREMELEAVLVPNLSGRLFSVEETIRKGHEVIFGPKRCCLQEQAWI